MEEQVLARGMHELIIDPEFESLLDSLAQEELSTLETSIDHNGCIEAICAWDGVIVDGHNRYKICWKLGKPFPVRMMHFANRNEAILWMIERQLGRRNVPPYKRAELLRMQKAILSMQAEERMMAGKKAQDPVTLMSQGQGEEGSPEALMPKGQAEEGNPVTLMSQGQNETGRTRAKFAKMVGVSEGTLSKIDAIDRDGDEETKKKLRRNEMSINKAFVETIRKKHEGKTQICERCGKEKPFEDFPLRPGKSRYETVCKECEAERKKEVQDMPSGMSSVGGFIRHSGYQLPDEPESFPKVQQQMQIALDNCVDSLELAFQNYTTGMQSAENDKIVDDLISSAFRRIRQMNNEHKKEANNHE